VQDPRETRYLAGALEVGGVGLDEVVGADVLHRQGGGSRRFRHPVAAAGAAVGRRRWGKWGGRCGCSRARVLWRRGTPVGLGIYIMQVSLWSRQIGDERPRWTDRWV
jgi:hypothetical protein